MNRKNNYKDLEKYKATCKRQKRRYYARMGESKNQRTPWSIEEIELILSSDQTDFELAKTLGRSINAIQVKRNRINKSKRKEEAS